MGIFLSAITEQEEQAFVDITLLLSGREDMAPALLPEKDTEPA